MLDPGLSIQAGMVRNRLDTIYLEGLGKFFHSLPAQAVDNPALTFILLDKSYDICINILCFGPYLVIEIWPVEGCFEGIGILYSKIFKYVLLYFRSSCCCEAYDRDIIPYTVNDISQVPVLWSEVMPPFTDTVRLIYCNERYADRIQKGDIIFLSE